MPITQSIVTDIEPAREFDESAFRNMVENALVGIYVIQDGRFVYANPRLAEIFGYTVAEVLALPSWIEFVSDSDRPKAVENMRKRLSGEVASVHYTYRGVRKDRLAVDVEVLGNTTQWRGGTAVVGTAIDITERLRAEAALRAGDDQFRSAFEYTNVAMALTDIDNRFIRVNDALAQMLGYTKDEILCLSMSDVTHPDHVAESYSRRQDLLSGKRHYFQMEKRYRHKDGHTIWALTNVALTRDADGKPLHYVGQIQDITERKRLEEHFRQAQKMEAIGQLAGGVAHDFNNLLTVISGYSEMLLTLFSKDDPARNLVQEIYKAGDRAAQLTRQLLAFSRKQIDAPRVLDINSIIAESSKMLQRLVGDDVALATNLAPDLGHVRIDPGQVDQVLMNLVVNARDAMPKGGKVFIETVNVDLTETITDSQVLLNPGRYVRLTVSDTGCGMDAATKARIFEPFFSTKPQGQGTGLGLATVYGIVKQAEGHIFVYSELGHGTSFKIYLPMIVAGDALAAPQVPMRSAPTGSETILLVEDAPAVRGLSRLALNTFGYNVIDAGDAEELARVVSQHQGRIHMLVTDVVMPEMSGREVAEYARRTFPGIKVLFVSGYTDDMVLRHGISRAEVAFLQKPFTPLALATKVRSVLDGELT